MFSRKNLPVRADTSVNFTAGRFAAACLMSLVRCKPCSPPTTMRNIPFSADMSGLCGLMQFQSGASDFERALALNHVPLSLFLWLQSEL